MTVDGVRTQCAFSGCVKPSRGDSKYCSGSCRAKASHARRYQPKKTVAIPPGTPLCWCGRRATGEENGRPKCGNHDNLRRARKATLRAIFRKLEARYSVEQLRDLANGGLTVLWREYEERIENCEASEATEAA
jgi:hypothetical protein